MLNLQLTSNYIDFFSRIVTILGKSGLAKIRDTKPAKTAEEKTMLSEETK